MSMLLTPPLIWLMDTFLIQRNSKELTLYSTGDIQYESAKKNHTDKVT